MGNTDYKASIIHRASTWTADQTFNDDVKLTLGTGGDADIYYDNTNLFIKPRVVGSGNIILHGDGPSDGGILFLNDDTNTNMTMGLTINVDNNNDEAISLKGSAVAHGGIDGAVETDTFGTLRQANTAAGVLRIDGFSDANEGGGVALQLVGSPVTEPATTKSVSARATIEILALKYDDDGAIDNTGADGNLASIRGYTSSAYKTRFIFDIEGSAHADVEWVAFDKYDDLALLDATQNVMTGRITPARFGDNSLYYDREYLEHTGIIGKDSWHAEVRDGQVQQRQMINFTKLAMLHHGAILQVGDRMMAIEKENKELRKMLAEGRN